MRRTYGGYKGAARIRELHESGKLQETVDACFERALGNAHAKSTRSSTSTAINAWKRFCMLHSFSELCVDRLGKCLGLEVVEMMVCKFSVFECLVREMDPASTFGSYTSDSKGL